MKFRLLHISDLHFGPHFRSEVAESLVEFESQLEADLIVNSGDLTHRAKAEQFASARNFFQRFECQKIVHIPGNHDVPLYRVFERVWNPFLNYSEYFGNPNERSFQEPGVTLVALNSTSPLRTTTNGRISRSQLLYCKKVFDKIPESEWRIVVAHHHFAPAPDYGRQEVLPNARRALRFLDSIGTDLILGGHLHRSYIGSSLDVLPQRNEPRGVTIVQCGTTTSSRGRVSEHQQNSLNVIDLFEGHLEVSHYLFSNKFRKFSLSSEHRFFRNSRDPVHVQ